MLEYILIGMILVILFINFAERRDFYDRLMSKDLNEYKGKSCRYIPPACRRAIKRWREKKDGEE